MRGFHDAGKSQLSVDGLRRAWLRGDLRRAAGFALHGDARAGYASDNACNCAAMRRLIASAAAGSISACGSGCSQAGAFGLGSPCWRGIRWQCKCGSALPSALVVHLEGADRRLDRPRGGAHVVGEGVALLRRQLEQLGRVPMQHDHAAARKTLIRDETQIARRQPRQRLAHANAAGRARLDAQRRFAHPAKSRIAIVADGLGAPTSCATLSSASSVVTASGNPCCKRSADSSASISPGR